MKLTWLSWILGSCYSTIAAIVLWTWISKNISEASFPPSSILTPHTDSALKSDSDLLLPTGPRKESKFHQFPSHIPVRSIASGVCHVQFAITGMRFGGEENSATTSSSIPAFVPSPCRIGKLSSLSRCRCSLPPKLAHQDTLCWVPQPVISPRQQLQVHVAVTVFPQ